MHESTDLCSPPRQFNSIAPSAPAVGGMEGDTDWFHSCYTQHTPMNT